MTDRRADIIEAGLATLREDGFTGFTQPRIAARLGLRQSHLTYYYATRADLLEAVARAAIGAQLAALDAALEKTSPKTLTRAIAKLVVRHGNTRILMALAQAAEQEPPLRNLFREMADSVTKRLARALQVVDPAATEVHARLLHAVCVGLGVIDLATDRSDGERRAAAVIGTALTMLCFKSDTMD